MAKHPDHIGQPGSTFASGALTEADLNAIVGGDGKEAPKETVTFEYGGLMLRYQMQTP